MSEHLEYATISMCCTVSYQGTDVSGYRFTRTTYDTADQFDWSELPADVPVIDCSSATFEQVWDALRGPTTYGQEHVEQYRAHGIPVRTVAEYQR